MKVLEIHRLNKCTFEGTFGVLYLPGHRLFMTGELSWHQNKKWISCIPGNAGYIVKWTYSPKYKRKMFIVKNVPNRFGIRMHSGNWVGNKKYNLRYDATGCILLGERLGYLKGQKALLDSRTAVRRFEKAMNRDETFRLIIRDPWMVKR